MVFRASAFKRLKMYYCHTKENPWLNDWHCRATGHHRESPLMASPLYVWIRDTTDISLWLGGKDYWSRVQCVSSWWSLCDVHCLQLGHGRDMTCWICHWYCNYIIMFTRRKHDYNLYRLPGPTASRGLTGCSASYADDSYISDFHSPHWYTWHKLHW